MNKMTALGTLILSFGMMLLPLATTANESYEAYYLFLGNYPNDANPGWHVRLKVSRTTVIIGLSRKEHICGESLLLAI